MEEPRWNNGAEEYRAILAMVRDHRPREALERASRALVSHTLGRKHSARLHSLICALHVEDLHQVCPAATLHGEEAVRLADAIRDPWVKCEALQRLVVAYCHMGDLERAEAACDIIAAELVLNPGSLPGAFGTLNLLRALVAQAADDLPGALAGLEQADAMTDPEQPDLYGRIRVVRAGLLLDMGRLDAARMELCGPGSRTLENGPLALDWAIARAWLAVLYAAAPPVPLLEQALEQASVAGHTPALAQCLALQALLRRAQEPQAAAALARQAMERCIATGRQDLLRRLRRQLEPLLAV